jgi:hypothetical protein
MRQRKIYICLSIVVLISILAVVFKVKEAFFEYLNHKSKCFDCEQDIIKRCGVDQAWSAQPTKSFDSELTNGWIAKTMKYY